MRIRVFILGLLLAASTQAQLLYRDASVFPLLGKATDATLTRYERLPASLESVSRKPLWDLGRNSAGLALRFRSNSTCIGAKCAARSDGDDKRICDHAGYCADGTERKPGCAAACRSCAGWAAYEQDHQPIYTECGQ